MDMPATVTKIVDAFLIEKSLFTTIVDARPASERILDIKTIDEQIAIKPKSDGLAILAIRIVERNPIIWVPPELAKLQK